MSEQTTLRVMIWGKTYPELSKRHAETVCTGAVDIGGRPIRLYPVPLRYLEGDQQYRIGDIVEVRASRNPSDNRPESYRIDPNSLTIVDHVHTDNQEWAERRQWVFRDASWHFENLDQLESARQKDSTSMGLVRPGVVEKVYLARKPNSARREYDEKWSTVTSQHDLFLPEYKALSYLPSEIRIVWRCAVPCPLCERRPHDMMVLDWGLLELARRDDWEGARQKLEAIADLRTHDFRLFIGNFFLHQQTFGVIGLWYPKRQAQRNLF
jgi:hypothetical protein